MGSRASRVASPRRASTASRAWLPGLACAAIAAAALLAGAPGCEADDAASAPGDAGLFDSYPPDVALADAAIPPGARAARLTLVNAAHDLGPAARVGAADGSGNAPLRLCFLEGNRPSDLAPTADVPLPDVVLPSSTSGVAGVDQGAAGSLRATSIPFARRIVAPVIVSARAAAQGGATCRDLLGSFVLQRDLDYWELPPIAAGTFADGKAYLLAITGCAADATTTSPAKCGPGYLHAEAPGPGNLALRVIELTGSPPPPGALGVHVLDLSTQARAVLSTEAALGAVHPGFVSDPSGANFRAASAERPPLFELQPLLGVPPVSEDDWFALGPRAPATGDDETLAAFFPVPLGQVAAQSRAHDGEPPFPFAAGLGFVFVILGDPDADETPQLLRSGRPNPRALHYLALPADPAPSPP
ncbi:MAG: hypothetical protein JWP97_3792 [Labilithrix sp.]|nr:hypothetical protein [Labilithrix sp.]